MKLPSLIKILSVVALFAVIAGCRHEAPQKAGPVETTTVEMRDYAFVPAHIKVKKGQTVMWTNRDLAEHTVTVEDASVSGPKSDYLDMDRTYSFTFDSVGTFNYHCEPHPYMKASVEVVE